MRGNFGPASGVLGIALAAALLASCSSGPSSSASTATTSRASPSGAQSASEQGAFCNAAKVFGSGIALPSGPSPVSNGTLSLPQLEGFKSALVTMRTDAPAAIRSDVDQLVSAWGPVISDLIDAYRNPGSTLPPSYAAGKKTAGDEYTGSQGSTESSWVYFHCQGGTGPTGTQSTTTSMVPATAAPTTTSSPPATAPSVPDLFVSTGATPPPGELYTWPHFPSSIQLNDNNWISGMSWSAGSQSASASGTYYTDLSCNGPAASCPPAAEGTVEFSATQRETCTVHYADPSTDSQESTQATVFDHLQYAQVSGSQAGQTYSFPSPCS